MEILVGYTLELVGKYSAPSRLERIICRVSVAALDLSGVPHLEYTALTMLIDAENRERDRGVSLWLVGLNPEVLSMIQRASLGNILGGSGCLSI